MNLKRAVLSIIFLLFLSNVFANHFMQLDLYYRWVSDSTYEITASYNRNCLGFTAPPPTSVAIQVNSVVNNYQASVNCQRLLSAGPFDVSTFNCMATMYCVDEYVYRGTWTAPFKADDFVFSYSVCCLPAGPSGPTNLSIGNLYVDCGLNNLDFPDISNRNNSPFWHNMVPVHPGHLLDTVVNPSHVSLCEGASVVVDQAITEYDNDFVKYEFINPRSAVNTNLSFINGWSFTNPLPSNSGPVIIDSIMGTMSFTAGSPTGSGVYMITLKATEYRYDTVAVGPPFQVELKEIGFVTRNLFVYINDSATCPDNSLSFADPAGLDTGMIFIDCPSQSFDIHFSSNFLCSSLDTNGSCLQLRHAATNTLIPIVKAKSSECNNMSTSDQFTIYVDTLLSPDTFELVIKQGNDLNTLLSECYFETTAYEDTLLIIFPEQPLGKLRGDHLGGGHHSNMINLDCYDSEIIVNMSKKFSCSSVALDGSDFIIYNIDNASTVFIKSAIPLCINGTAVRVRLMTDSVPPGNFILKLKEGNDTNTVENVCNVSWPEDSIPLHSQGLFPNLGKDTVYCEENTNFNLFLYPGNFYRYEWWLGSTSQSMLVNSPGTYWVNVYNENDCKATDTIHVSVKKCNSSVNENVKPDFSIYPVPAQDMIYLTTDNVIEHMNIKMIDLNGSSLPIAIKQLEQKRFAIDISELSDGIYIVEIQNASGISRKKVVKAVSNR